MSELSTHQSEAFTEVRERLFRGERYTSLNGYAGTGKTFLIGRLVEELLGEDETVCLCAPTHKAAQVAGEMIRSDLRPRTLHALLGLRLVPDLNGGYELVPERDRDLPDDATVIVDEASMVGAAEWAAIQEARGLVWLFVGDPAQLPPVNEDPSPALQQPGPLLEEVVRQERENPILSLATNLRNGAQDFASAFTSGEGVAVTSRRQALLESAVRAFKTDAFQDDPAYARILAYRNRTVRAYNRQVRTALFGDTAPRFSPGEWLVARDSWFVEGIPLLTNSEEVRVVSTTQTKEDDEDLGRWTVWQLAIEGPEDVTPREITVLHESEEERYQERLARFRKEAKAGEQDWERYYRLREHFASVDYAYASTIHKAQGSTYHTCFLDVRDTHAAPERDRQPLLYVAATRPARRLAVLV